MNKPAARVVVELVGRGWDQVKSPLYRNAIFIMLTSVISSGLGFFFWLIVANKYAKEDLGAAVTLFQTLGFIGALGNLGIGIGLIRYMGETEDKGKMINAGLTLCGVVTLALCLLFLVLLPVILPDLAFVLNDLLYVLTLVVCPVALGLAPVLDSVTIAVRRADLQTWRLTIFAVLKIPVALIVVTIPFLQGRAGIFLSLALSFGVSVAVLGFVLLPRTLSGYRPKPDFQFRATRPILRFSLSNYVAIAIGSAGALLPTPLIYGVLGPYDGPKNAAYFYVALIVASLLYIIPGAAFTSFYAEASQTNTDRRRGERQAILFSLLLLISAIAGMWLFSDWMLRLFGDPTYADEAVTPLRILTVASIPAFLTLAEVFIAIPGPASPVDRPFQPIGLSMHILLVFSLLFLSVFQQTKDATLAALLVAVSLASLVRVFSLAVPRFDFVASPEMNLLNTIPWLALVSIPLLVSVAAVAYVQRLGPRDLGLLVRPVREVPLQFPVAMTGIPLGRLEYAILRPAPWIPSDSLGWLLGGAVVIFLATGLSEELIFRGILLRRAVEALGGRSGLLYVTAIFASLHIFFLSGFDLLFVFGVGLFYGFVALKTKNLWRVILSHSLGNVILYLVAPFH